MARFGFSRKKRTVNTAGLATQSETFILERILTPSGLVDGGENALHPLVTDLHAPSVPDVHLTDTSHFDADIYHATEVSDHHSLLDGVDIGLIDHQILASHLVDVPIPDHQLEPLPFIHSLDLTTEPLLADTHLPTIDNSHLDSCNQTFTSGVFTVGNSGKVSIDYLFDGGKYQGQLAIFNLDGMEHFQPGSTEFITEAAHRALSNSNFGHIVISDATEAARFNSIMPGETQNWNSGEYQGVNTFSMRPGEHFGIMLVPNGTVQQVFEHPEAEGALHPLFSMSTANPNHAFHLGQIADVTNNGHTFVMEDLRVDGVSDHDYNDLIFQVRGATGTAVHLDDVIDHNHDWRTTDMGKALIDYAKPYDHPPVDLHPTITPSLEAPSVVATPVETSLTPIADTQGVKFHFPHAQQPLIGVIDTGFSADNPDIDYTHITLGHDYVAGDENPLLQPTEGSEHGTHVLGVIAGTNDNGIGIDGINDQAPIWVGRATGSGHWADALVDFVDYAKESGQPHAVVNLSLDLTQVNPDGSVTTRYEFTPPERAAIEYARQHDVLIVVAAGNDGGVMSALGQSSQEFDNIITVGASDGADRADYSSFGHGLDILAPGGTTEHPVLSTVGDGVGTMAGTSVATAEVTGAASQVWAANPDLSYRQVIELLKLTATDIGTPNWDLDTGAGLLNIAAAVQLGLVTAPEVYKPDSFSTPTTWGGAGSVTPTERAADFNGTIQNKLAVQINGGVNIRSGPGTSYSQVGKINSTNELVFDRETQGELVVDPNGEGSSSTWYHLADGRGWMSAVYIQKVSSPTPTPTPAPTPTPTPRPTPAPTFVVNRFYPTLQKNSWLGAPTSGEINLGNGVIKQTFANGYIIWNGKKATAYQTGSGKSSQSPPSNQPRQSEPFWKLIINSYKNGKKLKDLYDTGKGKAKILFGVPNWIRKIVSSRGTAKVISQAGSFINNFLGFANKVSFAEKHPDWYKRIVQTRSWLGRKITKLAVNTRKFLLNNQFGKAIANNAKKVTKITRQLNKRVTTFARNISKQLPWLPKLSKFVGKKVTTFTRNISKQLPWLPKLSKFVGKAAPLLNLGLTVLDTVTAKTSEEKRRANLKLGATVAVGLIASVVATPAAGLVAASITSTVFDAVYLGADLLGQGDKLDKSINKVFNVASNAGKSLKSLFRW
jgi:hypothetical protein